MNINNIHVLSRAVIIDHGYILLCKVAKLDPGFYFLPGGHVEQQESVIAALYRELHEETGCADAEIIRFLGCLEYSFAPESKVNNRICHNHEYNFIFAVRANSLIYSQTPQINPDNVDNLEFNWTEFDKIGEIDLRPKPLKTILPEWLRLESNNSFKSSMN